MADAVSEFEEIVPGHKAAAGRLLAAGGSIHEAWDSLGVFDWDAALNYLRGSPGFQAHCTRDLAYVDARVEARLTGLILGFAITAVEADREVHPDAEPDKQSQRLILEFTRLREAYADAVNRKEEAGTDATYQRGLVAGLQAAIGKVEA